MARARGCSDFCSALNSTDSISVSGVCNHISAVTAGCPWVIVPVLSNTMQFTLQRFSRAKASFIKIWFSAPLPIPTIRAVGVANPKAQGQAITRTETADKRA